MYDLIGDIHGYAQPLQALLAKLGYRQQQGAYRHPERQLIFLGDFIDRGPEQLAVLRLVRAMIEAGSARSVMGNHEYNAVAWATPDPEQPDSHLRPHSAKNRHQHQAFLAQVGEDSAEHQDWIHWFKTLPLWLDLPELRVIHACWHPKAQSRLAPLLDAGQRLTEAGWVSCSRRGSPDYQALEVLLKGLEVTLPDGFSYQDKDGVERHATRTRWWRNEAQLFNQAAMLSPDLRKQLPASPIPAQARLHYDNQKPVFIGHYWLKSEPKPLSPHIACLDYSIAKGGKLCAYRWEGEATLRTEQFVWVEGKTAAQ